MAKKYLFFVAFLVNVFLFTACKKEEDNYGPDVTFNTPADNQFFNVNDAVLVNANIKDQTKIASVIVTLVNENYIPVNDAVSARVNSPQMVLNISYLINNIHLEDGLYYIQIKASDGKNTSNTYRPITIGAVPKVLRKIMLTTTLSSSSTHVLFVDSLLSSITPYRTFTGDWLGSSVSSYFQQMYVCGNYSGSFTGVKLEDNTVKFAINPLLSPDPYFTAYYSLDKTNYVARYDGYIKGYDNNGNPSYTAAANTNYYVSKLIINNGIMLAEETSKTGGGKILVSFYSTGAPEQQVAITQDVVTFCEKDDNNVFVFGNLAGQGVLQLYDRIHNNLWNPYGYALATGAITCAVKIDADTYLIGHSNGTIYKYQYTAGSVTTFLSGYNSVALKYDSLARRVYIAEPNLLTAIDYVSKTVVGSINSAVTIVDATLLYNR